MEDLFFNKARLSFTLSNGIEVICEMDKIVDIPDMCRLLVSLYIPTEFIDDNYTYNLVKPLAYCTSITVFQEKLGYIWGSVVKYNNTYYRKRHIVVTATTQQRAEDIAVDYVAQQLQPIENYLQQFIYSKYI